MVALLLALWQNSARADWQRDGNTLAWRAGTNVVWQFSFDAKRGKPFFYPVSVAGGPSLADFKPQDHPWHYGLWFSWKYINTKVGDTNNHINYWEENITTGESQGKTRWTPPVIDTKPDGGATIRMDLSYVAPSGHVDMTEKRELMVSAPLASGAYTIDWRAHFVVGDADVVLDRTAMVGEPGGATNGGYGGLAFRLAGLPLGMSMLSTGGVITNFPSERARPNAPAVAINFNDAGKPVGGVGFFSDKANAGENAPWYLVNETKRVYRFANAAILAPKPIPLPAGGHLDLNYRLAIQPEPWRVESLKAAQMRWAAGNGK